ncbi:TPA: MFS transporter, partial [Staphylococcus aureus]|nr:MFS transporter [Staphylococcus aureus]
MRNVYAFNIDLKQRNRVIAVVMIGAFVGVLNQTLMTTILPEIMKDFTVSSSTAQWLTTIFMLGINFPMLLVGRSIQALGAGILMPLTQTLLFIMFPPEKRGMAMGMFGLVIGFAPAIGPTAAGWFVN